MHLTNDHLRVRSQKLVLALVVMTLTVLCDPDRLSGQDWTPLFNGEDLQGWTVKIRGYELGENFGNTFRVEDRLLKVVYNQYDTFDNRFGHLFFEQTYSHYRLRVEYRFVGEQCRGGPGWAWRNSGVMIHGQTAESVAKDQDFPNSIEVQILGGNGQDKRPTANLCTPGTRVVINGELVQRHCVNSRSETYHGDQWVTVEIEVRGSDVVRHQIDGTTVLEYHQPQLDNGELLEQGTISIQSESHPVEFRRIDLLPLEQS